MSFLLQNIRNTTELSPTAKLFLHTLNTYADQSGVCWPSQATIATAMSVSVRTVKRALRECVELKLVRVRRRWRKSNVYRLLCIQEPPSINGDTGGPREQTKVLKPNVKANGALKKRWKSPSHVKILVEDLCEFFGPVISDRNMGWFYRIARAVPDDTWIHEAISWVKQAVMESEVQAPCGLLTWKLRQMGAAI